MQFLGNFISAIAQILHIVINLFMYTIIARAILSWVNPDPFNPIVRFIHNITEPVLSPVRRKMPIQFGEIDLSPIAVILGCYFLQSFLVRSLFDIANNLTH